MYRLPDLQTATQDAHTVSTSQGTVSFLGALGSIACLGAARECRLSWTHFTLHHSKTQTQNFFTQNDSFGWALWGYKLRHLQFQPANAHNCHLIHNSIYKTENSQMFLTLLVHRYCIKQLAIFWCLAFVKELMRFLRAECICAAVRIVTQCTGAAREYVEGI